MRTYRAYVVAPQGYYSGVHEIERADDEAAIATAKGLAAGHDIELWERDRFIGRLKMDKGPPPPKRRLFRYPKPRQ